ncbi:chromatin DNA-binding EKC/KEOPS complex subunit PCC1 Ecym_4016 [Eremothecium cymbalariae DBVPG|uniref:Transcription factor Pcc1 n=1 Tax=Eremothecium cymbalariae (strain CBS 270.75 / DBVPG 7215 / KCTC 17166 / NRRL Y-17582) TaxID=931890 RepID=G8JSU7_ERECY|nr:hypothetical protein Ecym_4016 [Eremothecium cymbalariae DBVPG\
MKQSREQSMDYKLYVSLAALESNKNLVCATSFLKKSLDHRSLTLPSPNRCLEVPFENGKQAEIAREVLHHDPVLRPEDFRVDYTIQHEKLLVNFNSIDARSLRVGVSSVIESIKTVVETMDEFSL